MPQRSATHFQALVGHSIAHPERLVRNLTRSRRTRRRRGSFGLILGFAVLAGLLALAVRFFPLSHPALPPPPEGSVYNLG
jgi:ferric-dicitrate binding protein FerR (iron transport regulator)